MVGLEQSDDLVETVAMAVDDEGLLRRNSGRSANPGYRERADR